MGEILQMGCFISCSYGDPRKFAIDRTDGHPVIKNHGAYDDPFTIQFLNQNSQNFLAKRIAYHKAYFPVRKLFILLLFLFHNKAALNKLYVFCQEKI